MNLASVNSVGSGPICGLMPNSTQRSNDFNARQVRLGYFSGFAKAMMQRSGRIDTNRIIVENPLSWKSVSSIGADVAYIAYRRLASDSLHLEVESFVSSPYLDEDAKETINHSVSDALSFLSVIPGHLDSLSASYSDDGEVVFTWVKNDLRAEVGFPGDAYIEYTYRLEGRFVSGKFNCTVKEFPRDLLEYLK